MMDVKNRPARVTILFMAAIATAIVFYFAKAQLLTSNSTDEPQTDSYKSSRPEESNDILTDGVLRIKTDILEERSDTIRIYHADQSLYGAIYSENDETEPAFNGSDSLAIRSYYPDYYVVIMDCYGLSEGQYRVKIGGSEKYMEHKDGITIYEDWATHLKSSFIVTKADNPLRETPEIKGEIAGDYDYKHLSFYAIQVSGDWVQVVCDMDCEGCPNQEQITGWLKWRDGNRLLVELYYAC